MPVSGGGGEPLDNGTSFDLNIEKVLEDWEVYHALREIIANALDEKVLTSTPDIKIHQDAKGIWHIRDFGRGLQYRHLTQKENDEKLRHPHLIGKFGVGLKDALATFERRGVKVLIRSRYGEITLERATKAGFTDIVTLHARISPPTDPSFVGTEFLLEGCTNKDIKMSKSLFLCFNSEQLLEKTEFGEVLERAGDSGRIYINGVRVADEENFLFSYNITSLNQAIKKALNRERTNVGRSAYTDRVKAVLLSCRSEDIAARLTSDLQGFESGSIHDEMSWQDVAVHAVKLLNASRKVIFVSPSQMLNAGGTIADAIASGYTPVVVPDSSLAKLSGSIDAAGNPVRDLGRFAQEYNESFAFRFVSPKKLKSSEAAVFGHTDAILQLVGGKPSNVKEILISETMRLDESLVETKGLWEESTGRVIIKRSMLSSIRDYAGVLLHEIAHAECGAGDYCRTFENQLSAYLGQIAAGVVDASGGPVSHRSGTAGAGPAVFVGANGVRLKTSILVFGATARIVTEDGRSSEVDFEVLAESRDQARTAVEEAARDAMPDVREVLVNRLEKIPAGQSAILPRVTATFDAICVPCKELL